MVKVVVQLFVSTLLLLVAMLLLILVFGKEEVAEIALVVVFG